MSKLIFFHFVQIVKNIYRLPLAGGSLDDIPEGGGVDLAEEPHESGPRPDDVPRGISLDPAQIFAKVCRSERHLTGKTNR